MPVSGNPLISAGNLNLWNIFLEKSFCIYCKQHIAQHIQILMAFRYFLDVLCYFSQKQRFWWILKCHTIFDCVLLWNCVSRSFCLLTLFFRTGSLVFSVFFPRLRMLKTEVVRFFGKVWVSHFLDKKCPKLS